MIRVFFNKAMMSDPGVSMAREYLQVAADGTYSASTIAGCNTRKYHGLLVVPDPGTGMENQVLLSTLDESVFCSGESWQLATHQYPGTYYPEGYGYIKDFEASPVLQWTYVFGPFVLKKQLLLGEHDGRLMIRYMLEAAPEEVRLRLTPLLGFRNAHWLSKANADAEGWPHPVVNGISIRLYPDYAPLYLQLSVPAFFHASPDWYYNIEYEKERERGYECHEDLFTPGYFEHVLREGESVVFTAGLTEMKESADGEYFEKTLAHKPVFYSSEACLHQAARQFIIETPEAAYIKAGFYWFGSWGRDTCIALPGLTLQSGDTRLFEKIADTILDKIKHGVLPNMLHSNGAAYNTADASLWFIWAIMQYARHFTAPEGLWKKYGPALKSILDHYRNGALYGIVMDEDRLITAAYPGLALTWMDALCNGVPVTPRMGKPVELNALWYNALCFCLELAKHAGDESFVKEWEGLPAICARSFIKCFWNNEKGYLADCVTNGEADWSVRPNQIFAVSLGYSPLPATLQRAVVDKVADELLTPRGLRTLSSSHSSYHGRYEGSQEQRDQAYHQGTVWPWLLGHFSEAYLKVYDDAALPLLQEIYEGMAPALEEFGLYTIAELYDGDFPYRPGGAVAQAWSVAELIRMRQLLTEYRARYKAGLLKA